MPERFRSPPLVELVAELRWGPLLVPSQAQGVIVLAPGPYEEFFTRFGSRVSAFGYDWAERLDLFLKMVCGRCLKRAILRIRNCPSRT